MLARVPEDYDQNYLTMSRRGARVLALGWRDLGPLSHQELKVQAVHWGGFLNVFFQVVRQLEAFFSG
jgi:hypothetical protein